MEISELNERIKSGNVAGRYILGGEEDYLKRFYARELVRVALDGTDGIFDRAVFDGDGTDTAEIAEALISPALTSKYKVVEWRFPTISSMKERELAALERLAAVQAENPDTVLILTVSADGFEFSQSKVKSKSERRFEKSFDLVNFKKSTDRQLLGWLNRHFTAEGITVDAAALNTLLATSGKNMDVLINEVQKLAFFAHGRGDDTVCAEDVRRISSQTPESEAFALQNAITNRDKAAAFRALDDLRFRRVDPAMILATVERTLTELLNVGMLAAEGSTAEAERLLGVKDFKLKICLAGAKKYGTAQLADILGELVRLDARSKVGGISGYKLCELFISEYI